MLNSWSEEISTSTLGLKVVSYEIPEGAFQTEWQRKAYEVFLMQLALKAEKGPGHEGFFDATELAELQEEAPQTSHSSRDEVMLKDVLQLESWPEIYRHWMLEASQWHLEVPFGQKEFEAIRKLVKMDHEEQIAKGWIMVKTLKEQNSLVKF
ncbi:hypothetical protein B9Z55_026012 [Caenorhabditis nigoni]|uniref:Uncharacterized protein n=1 Tax=Caenorhabditis nigoni TaxID=1611254 RepID=A0A2G5T0V6_9PELO|nr:hypothetical protein B9Z55_026012 [Caenorhabditis nigoni]